MASDQNQIQYESCPVCGSDFKPWRSKKVGDETYRMDHCQGCGYCFVNPRPTLEFLMDYYSTFGHGDSDANKQPPTLQAVQEKERVFPNSTLDAKRMVQTITKLTSGAKGRFLDVGCGYGFFSAEAIRAGFDVCPLELATNEGRIAKEMTGLEPIATSFEDFNPQSERFDVVLMSQILEHALDVNLWIDKSRTLLERNGILAIALPNYDSIFRRVLQERDPFVCPPTHLNFFNPQSLSRLLNKHGFSVESVQWVSRMPKSTFERRCPKFVKPLLPMIHWGTTLSLGLVDTLRLGMIISVYGRKKNSN